MATAPTVLAGYIGLRRALAAAATADGRTRSAVAVAASAADHGDYTLAVNSLLAKREGWSEEQITVIAGGRCSGDAGFNGLLDVVREAVAGDRSVSHTAWTTARDAGWSPELLAEAFAYIRLLTYCDRFSARRRHRIRRATGRQRWLSHVQRRPGTQCHLPRTDPHHRGAAGHDRPVHAGSVPTQR